MPKTKEAVFLNIPYDSQFTCVYLAYIMALSAIGLLPRATLGITGNRRLDRIAGLIESCAYSIHDLSRVQLDRHAPRASFQYAIRTWPDRCLGACDKRRKRAAYD